MARPRTPTKVLDARGAFRRNPQRRRDGEPEVRDPLGSAPDRLTDVERQCWLEIADSAPTGVLTKADRLTVEQASRLLALDLAGDLSSSDRKLFLSVLGKLGLNPSDRARLSIPKVQADDNPYAALDK